MYLAKKYHVTMVYDKLDCCVYVFG